MKKNLFLIACVAPLIGFAQATAFIGANAKVTNKANTLITVAGDMKVAAATGVNVNNHGNINVTGGFVNNDLDGTNFVNRFTDATNYGQLILDNDDASSINGAKVSGEFKLVDGFAFHSFAIPYQATVAKVLAGAGISNPQYPGYSGSGYDNNRLKNPLFKWDNATSILEHYDAGTATVGPFDYLAFGNVSGYTPAANLPTIGSNTTYTGTLNLNGNYTANLWNETVNNTKVNKYGELYGTYVEDPFVTSPTDAAWKNLGVSVSNAGKYGTKLALLGNPYTSNIDLTQTTLTNATAVMQFKNNTYVNQNGNTEAVGSSSFLKATLDNGAYAAGDQSAMYVRPFHTFVLKASTASVNWNFDNSIKTFEDGAGSVSAPSFKNGNNEYYQVGIDLYDGQGNNTNNRFYVVASDNYLPSGQSNNEAYSIELADNHIGAYTLQETADGGIDQTLIGNKTYINGINATDYVAKPVHVVFQGSTGGDFIFKARLSEALLNSGNKFYFEDKVEGVIKEITPDFVYNFSQAGTVADRFVMYYNGLPSDLNVAEVAAVAETVVYQDINKTHNIRFAKDLNSADIFVYALSGQLVFTDKNVKTDVDYVLPKQAQAGAFVVKIIGDNGNVTTKKIVQQ